MHQVQVPSIHATYYLRRDIGSFEWVQIEGLCHQRLMVYSYLSVLASSWETAKSLGKSLSLLASIIGPSRADTTEVVLSPFESILLESARCGPLLHAKC